MILLKSFAEYIEFVLKVHYARGSERFRLRLVPNLWTLMLRTWIANNLFLMYCVRYGVYEEEIQLYFPSAYNMFFRWNNRNILFLLSATAMAFYSEAMNRYLLDQTPVLMHNHIDDFSKLLKLRGLTIRQGLLLQMDSIEMPSYPYLRGYNKELVLFIVKITDLSSLGYVYVIVIAFLLAPLLHFQTFVEDYKSPLYTVWELVTAYYWWFQVMNVIRLTLYLGMGHVVIAVHLMVPLRQFYKLLRRNFRYYNAYQLKLIMYYFHRMYIFHYLEFDFMDAVGIRAFFMKAFIYVMLFCMINTAALLTASYEWSLSVSVVVLTALTTGFLSGAVFFLIYEANSLSLSGLQLASVLAMKPDRSRINGQPLNRLVKISFFFELLHSKKSFRFNMGPFGRITSKAWIGFGLFYSGWVFTLMSDYF